VLKGQPLPRVNALVDLYNASASATSCQSGAKTPTGSKVRCG
jgi:DNA/RNA-binding domain of Phe-tRNA-synthetase-like protein